MGPEESGLAPRQRIFVLIDRYLPILGGAQGNVHEICRRLAARGHRVTVLTRAVLPGLARRERRDGVEVRRFGRVPLRAFSKLACAAHIAWTLLRERRRCDVVLCAPCHPVVDLLPAWLAGLATGRPYLVRTTGIDTLDLLVPRSWGRRRRLLERALPRPLWRRVVRGSAAVVAQSEATRGRFRELGIARCEVVANGVDARRFAPATPEVRAALRRRLGLPPDRMLVVTSGRYVREKNQITLVRALEQVERELRPGALRLVILGATEPGQSASNEAALKREVAARGLSGLVRFVDDARNVEDWLRAADLFALPTRYPEGLSNALLEAMACGLPVLCSDLPQNAAALPSEARRLFAPDDAAALARELVDLCGSPALRARLGERLAAHARRHFDVDHAIARWEALLRAARPRAASRRAAPRAPSRRRAQRLGWPLRGSA